MPVYEYACKACGQHLEVAQSFKDDPLTECPACGGPLRKVFGSIGISFKGSGFYRTDSRAAAKRDAAKETAGAGKAESGSESKGDGGGGGKADKAGTGAGAKADTAGGTLGSNSSAGSVDKASSSGEKAKAKPDAKSA